MTDKTEAQPEALRLAEAQRYSEVVHHANVKASLAYVARKTGLGYQETERLLELALQRGDLAEGDYSGRKMENTADDRLASLEAQLVAQTNRAAAAEQQVAALTQRLDMANRLNTDGREQLAQLTKKNAWLEDEMRSQCNIHGMAAEREATRMTQNQRMHERIAELEAQLSARQAAPEGWRQAAQAVIDRWDSPLWRQEVGTNVLINDLRAMLSATPPPPEREPLTDEWHHNSRVESAAGIRDALSRTGVNLTITTILQLVDITRKAHGIGATND